MFSSPCRRFISAMKRTEESLPMRPSRTQPLAGTVPYHTSYLLLHSRESATSWPSVFGSYLFMELQRRLKRKNGLVNFVWFGEEHAEALLSNEREEGYSATYWRYAHPLGIPIRVDIPWISMSNIDEVLDSMEEVSTVPCFYVCCHQNRDCRCGIRGGQFAADLRSELHTRGMLLDSKGRPRIGQVGHVGGHKNAPNLLVFPYGDWYGNLEQNDIPALVEFYKPGLRVSLHGPNRYQWRGRMGLTKEDQIATLEPSE